MEIVPLLFDTRKKGLLKRISSQGRAVNKLVCLKYFMEELSHKYILVVLFLRNLRKASKILTFNAFDEYV